MIVREEIIREPLFSGTDDEQHEYEYLGAWGPRFDKLADMYGPTTEESEEED